MEWKGRDGWMEGLKLGTTSLAAENGGKVTIHMTLIAAYALRLPSVITQVCLQEDHRRGG